jgi:hypothetical protein
VPLTWVLEFNVSSPPTPRVQRPAPSELAPAKPNEPLLNEARRVALHKLPVRSAPETPEQPAFAQVCFDFYLPMSPLLKAETQDGLCRTNYMPVSVNHGKTTALGIVRRAA